MTDPAWYQITASAEKITEEDIINWFAIHSARDWAIGREKGIKGYDHFQIVVRFRKGIPEKTMIDNWKAFGHVTVSHAKNFDYALKTGNYITSWGSAIQECANITLAPWQEEATKLLDEQD